MNQFTTSWDIAFFDHLLASMDINKESNPVSMPHPTMPSYNPVYQPTPTYPLSNITMNLIPDPFFGFDLPLDLFSSTTSSGIKSEPLNPSSKFVRREEAPPVPTSSFPPFANFTTFNPVVPTVDFNYMPPPPSTTRNYISEPKGEPLEFQFKDEVIPGSSSHETTVPTSDCNREPLAPSGEPLKPKSERKRRRPVGIRYKTVVERKEALEQDPFVLKFDKQKNAVWCTECKNRTQLDNRKAGSLHLQNWNTHKARCAAIKVSRLLLVTLNDFLFFSPEKRTTSEGKSILNYYSRLRHLAFVIRFTTHPMAHNAPIQYAFYLSHYTTLFLYFLFPLGFPRTLLNVNTAL